MKIPQETEATLSRVRNQRIQLRGRQAKSEEGNQEHIYSVEENDDNGADIPDQNMQNLRPVSRIAEKTSNTQEEPCVQVSNSFFALGNLSDDIGDTVEETQLEGMEEGTRGMSSEPYKSSTVEIEVRKEVAASDGTILNCEVLEQGRICRGHLYQN